MGENPLASLASTFPHHKHIPPILRHHRVPAANMSFNRPNLSGLVGEIEALSLRLGRDRVAHALWPTGQAASLNRLVEFLQIFQILHALTQCDQFLVQQG